MGVATAIAAAAAVASTAAAVANRPKKPGQPNAPNSSADYTSMTNAAENALPGQVNAELAAQQQYYPQAQQQQIDLMAASAPQLAQQSIDISKQYAPQFIDLMQKGAALMDPNAVKLRDTYGKQVLSDLESGRNLSPEQSQNAMNDIRNAQIARGNTDGTAPAVLEATMMNGAREQMFNQRLQNAASYFGLPSIQNLSAGIPTGYAPLPTPQGFTLLNANAGIAGVNAGSQNYATQAGMYNGDARNYANTPNPWTTGLGQLAGVAGNYAALGYANKATMGPNNNMGQGAYAGQVNTGAGILGYDPIGAGIIPGGIP